MATDRDLLRTARAAMLRKTLKKKEKVATASVCAGIQKRRRLAGKKNFSEATETETLKLKKEAVGATRLLGQVGVPGALERWVEEALAGIGGKAKE
jgi:hypothetical protein